MTTFEITTALGFLYFARQKVDAAVIEVGLGGRLDATNVVDPLVSVITSLSMDHMAVLGDTLPKIAFEKAGIIKPGRPVVLAPQREEARQVVEQVAAERSSPLVEVGRDYHIPGWRAFVWMGRPSRSGRTGEQPVELCHRRCWAAPGRKRGDGVRGAARGERAGLAYNGSSHPPGVCPGGLAGTV